ncbi:MAG: hypothetical protein COB14_03640 [Alphaproteobacteria bacterium]|nr:MAG: hypothetical protein COB14_03640 [Alphaproteobacteria bacterium]
MDEKTAIEIRDYALSAIKNLNSALNAAHEKCSDEDFEKLKKFVGTSMGNIDIDILWFLYKKFPEIDDLKEQ